MGFKFRATIMQQCHFCSYTYTQTHTHTHALIFLNVFHYQKITTFVVHKIQASALHIDSRPILSLSHSLFLSLSLSLSLPLSLSLSMCKAASLLLKLCTPGANPIMLIFSCKRLNLPFW